VTRAGLIAVVLVLLVGSAAAFAWTEKLKLAPARVAKPDYIRHYSPGRKPDPLSFVIRRAQALDVSVVDADGHHVATLAEGKDERAGRVSFLWDGKNDAGEPVPDGVYRLKVRLHDERRTILIPSTIHVDTTAPKARILGVRSIDGIAVRYSSDESARPLLLLDGKVVLRGDHHRPGDARVRWPGPVPSGSHQVTLVLVDRAGNRSQPTAPVTVVG
jgi:hypothetical protein